MGLLLTVDVVFNPGEGDGALPAALAEPQQEGARTLVAQQSLLSLLADEAHDGAARREKTTSFTLDLYGTRSAHSQPQRRSPVVPQRQQVSFNHVQDAFDPQPEGKSFLVGTLLRGRRKRRSVRQSAETAVQARAVSRKTVAHLAELGPGDQPLRVPLGFASCRENHTVTSWISL